MNEEIFEDGYTQDMEGYGEARHNLMDESSIKRADFYLKKYYELKADVEEKETEWEEIHNLYKGDRESSKESDPNSYVNVILPNIEGQVSALTNHNITAQYRGKGYSDQKFARTASVIGDLILRENRIKQKVKRVGRRYLLLGNAFLTVGWNPDALDGFGMPTMEASSVTKVFIDGKIKDIEKVQEADFIIEEVGSKSIMWARRKYGDKIADAITLGNADPEFQAKNSTDDEESFTMLRVWTRNNDEENLQLIEYSLCGIELSASDSKKPYFKYVYNKYPIFMSGLYPVEGELYRFGDGQVLKSIQELINKLYDEIILAIKFSSQGRTYANPRSGLNPNEFAEADPSKVIYVKNPQQDIKTEQGAGINQVVFNLLQQLFSKVQEATRFSALMTGNSPERGMTATQAGIQQQQGVTGIDDKRGDISRMVGDALNYCIGLCMEFWSTAKAFRIVEDDEEFEWIDPRQLTNIPVMIPANSEYLSSWKKNNPHAKDKPKWMNLQVNDEEEGIKKNATKQLELDIDVTIGEGMPSNKSALFNIVLSLSQLALPDETGQPRPLLSYEQARKMIEDILGIKIETLEKEQAKMGQPMDGQPPMGGGQPRMNNDFNVPNANAQGQMKGGVPNGI